MALNKMSFVFLYAFVFLSIPAFGFSPSKADFSVKIRHLQIPYTEFAVFSPPGEKLKLDVLDDKTNYEYRIETELLYSQKQKRSWELTVPPQKGIYSLKVVCVGTNRQIHINIFSTVPGAFIKNEHLNGYRIGKYPGLLTGKPFVTKPPSHFIEVTEQNRNVSVSPHFKLDQFLCNQESVYPKYLVLDEVLILKLEMILEEVNQRGYPADTFHIMSGYRTPYYNKAIGNVAYSRHLWGKAADIFIDQNPVDNKMDDLNKDGIVDIKDAKLLYDIIDSLVDKKWYQKFLGGLGSYGSNSSHGPFVHIDSRGYKARW